MKRKKKSARDAPWKLTPAQVPQPPIKCATMRAWSRPKPWVHMFLKISGHSWMQGPLESRASYWKCHRTHLGQIWGTWRKISDGWVSSGRNRLCIYTFTASQIAGSLKSFSRKYSRHRTYLNAIAWSSEELFYVIFEPFKVIKFYTNTEETEFIN